MNLLITGADGFIGRNLRAALQQTDHRLYLIDVDTGADELHKAAAEADFVFHLAGVNRPKNDAEFAAGNTEFTEMLLGLLENGRKPPVLMSSSTQATQDNAYGKSKLQAEQAVLRYQEKTNSPVFIYRLTNVFGKWSRPNYNSAVATFCYNIARGLPITISDPAYVIRLAYIDDVVTSFIQALNGSPIPSSNGYCVVEPEHSVTLKRIVTLLHSFQSVRTTLNLPNQRDPFVRKLFATYQSFLPPDQLAYNPKTHGDLRGSFAELLHMGGYGQVSVNVTKPGISKGSHWHHTKHEKFIVVAGNGVIRFRDLFGDTVYTYEVSGDHLTVIDVPPGYVHILENTGSGDLVTLMWASEVFDGSRPDTYHQMFEE